MLFLPKPVPAQLAHACGNVEHDSSLQKGGEEGENGVDAPCVRPMFEQIFAVVVYEHDNLANKEADDEQRREELVLPAQQDFCE